MAKRYVDKRDSSYYVAGTRVSLDSVIHEFHDGASPESIHQNFETLTLEQIYGAIAYYLAHQAELDVYLERQQEAFESKRKHQSHVTPQLRAKLEGAREQSLTKRT